MQLRIIYICSFEICNRCKWLECNMGKPSRIGRFTFLHIPYRSKVELPVPTTYGMTNSETEMCMWK